MQLYIVTWKFESSEDQNYSSEAFVDYVESGKSEDLIDGYERIAWAHTPQDGTGVIIVKLQVHQFYSRFLDPGEINMV